MNKHEKTKIDLDQLSKEIRGINHRKQLFVVLKRELDTLGYWKNKKRGKGSKTYFLGIGKNKRETKD